MLKNTNEQTNEYGQVLGFDCAHWQPKQPPTPVILKGQYCTLEPLDLNKHSAQLYSAFSFNNKGETWTYLPFGPFKNYAEFENWLKQDALRKMYYSLIDHEQGSAQGLAAYHDIDPKQGVIEVGSIHFSKAIQKTRTATESMYLMMYQVFEELQYRRYQWRCNALNINSRKAAERLGFKYEGIFRQSNVVKGYNRDTAWYSIIDSEWPELKCKFQRWLEPSNFDAKSGQIIRLQDI